MIPLDKFRSHGQFERRRMMTSRKDLSSYDWERDDWKAPEPPHTRSAGRWPIKAGVLLFAATVVIGLGVVRIDALSQSAGGIATGLMARAGIDLPG